MKVTIGNVAQAADLEQFAGARLDALGRVDHHHRRVDRGQRAIGVLGEVLVAGRVEQVEDAIAIFEGHHRGDDGNAALALDAHPVGAGLAAVGLGAHLAGELDRAAEQQQLFGERGLAGVGMRDDGEGAPTRDRAGFSHGSGDAGKTRPPIACGGAKGKGVVGLKGQLGYSSGAPRGWL